MNDFKATPIIDLAAIIANHLQLHGIDVVLVGGLAVEIYSENLYLTKDIDMVDTSYQEPTVFRRAMAAIGFIKQGRVYINETTDICVEFPTAPLSVGDELIKEITVVNTPAGAIPILFATDVIKDRLAAYFHWQDRPSLVQALAIMINHAIDPSVLKDFCHREGKDEEYDLIRKLHQSSLLQQFATMSDIEKLVINEVLNNI